MEAFIILVVSVSVIVIGGLGYRMGVRYFARFGTKGWRYGLLALLLSPLTVAVAFLIAVILDHRRGGSVSFADYFDDIQDPRIWLVFTAIALVIHVPAFVGSVITSVRASRTDTSKTV